MSSPADPSDSNAALPIEATPPEAGPPVTRKRRGPSRTAMTVTGALAGVLVLAGALALVVPRSAPTAVPGRASGGSAAGQTVPATQVQRVHSALHDMGARCTPSADVAAQHRIGTDVDLLIGFARRYPDARFSVDGEDGRALDLLLIAATEMRGCAPAAARRAEQALPPQFQSPAASPAPPASAALAPRK